MNNINKIKNLKQLEEKLSDEKKELLQRLKEKSWFTKTDFEIQKKLFGLPDDFYPFLSDLAMRPDNIGNLDVIKLDKIEAGNYHVLCVFKTRSQVNNQVIDYEYVATKYGKNPGFKGLIFLEVDGEIKYFIIKKTARFPLGYEAFDSIGGFIQFRNGQLINLPKRVEDEIKRQLATNTITIKRFIDLGQMYTDTSMTNNHISLFAAIINGDNLEKVSKMENKIFKTKGISFETQIIPIERLREYLYKIDDSYFHTCIARLASMGVIKL